MNAESLSFLVQPIALPLYEFSIVFTVTLFAGYGLGCVHGDSMPEFLQKTPDLPGRSRGDEQ